MSQRVLLFGVLALLAALTSPSLAQRSSLISQSEANRFGLQRMWFTRIQFDRARGRIVDMRQHVSSKYGYTVYEIRSERGRTVITDRDLDRFGVVLGKPEAEKQANKLLQQLTRSGIKVEMTTQVFPEITLYVTSDTGVLQAIDGETGRTRWVAQVGNPRYPVEAPGANDDYVAVVNGSSIYVLDQATGNIAWRRQAMGSPGAGPALTPTLLYLPMINGRIESYELSDFRLPPWVYQAQGRSMIQPVVGSTTVAWPTDRGHLYVARANSQSILYRLETNNPMVAPPTPMPPNRLVAVSTDGYVYCIHENSGGLRWRFSTGEPIIEPAVVIGNAVFIVTDEDNLFRLDSETGQEVWWAPRVREVITASKDRLYCIGDTGRLLIFDAKTGGRLGALSTEVLDLRMVNHQTDRLFIGTRAGIVQCLREVQAEWPVVHAGGLEEAAEDEEAGARPKPMPAAAPAAAPAADPFGGGGGGGADPFGGGSGDTSEPSDPFAPSGGTSSEDPFGGSGDSGGEDPFM
jgi:outer membrane protein assembly factor BamB